MLAGCLRKGRSIRGYIEKGFVDPSLLTERHEELVKEMDHRGYRHSSPIRELPELLVKGHINTDMNLQELTARCYKCRERKATFEAKEHNQ